MSEDRANIFPSFLTPKEDLPILTMSKRLTQGAMEEQHPQDFYLLRWGEIQTLQTGIVNFINFINERRCDPIFFIDKSGRPAAYLFKKVWWKVFPEYQLPIIHFVNISPPSKINPNPIKPNPAELQKYFGDLNNHSICIADDYIESGGTLKLANKLFRTAYPKAKAISSVGIFDKFPSWIDQEYWIGVSDLEAEDRVSPNFSTPLYKKMLYGGHSPEGLYKNVIKLRSELALAAELISETVTQSRD